MDCLWGGGRLGEGEDNPREVLDLMKMYHISARLTFSNSMLEEEHLCILNVIHYVDCLMRQAIMESLYILISCYTI